MHRAIRTQVDQLGDEASAEAALAFDQDDPENRSATRQEFVAESDINVLLRRFGVDTPTRPVDWGQEVDYSLDLAAALSAADQAREAHAKLPADLRRKYPSWRELMRALDDGHLRLNISKERPAWPASSESTTATQNPPGAPASSPSAAPASPS